MICNKCKNPVSYWSYDFENDIFEKHCKKCGITKHKISTYTKDF